jgi:AAA15 family ATPase/GTPase
MLLEFSVNNFLSFKDSATLSMNTSSKDSGNCFQVRKYELLTDVVVYGANASGKSNLLKALYFMRNMVLNEFKITQSTDSLPHFPFKLSTETEDGSSHFEIVFFQNDIKYRYGFEADDSCVYAEWLFADEKGKESKLFFRDVDENDFYVNKQKFKEGLGLSVLPNHLFIWKCDQNNGPVAREILKWFSNLNFIDGLENESYIHYTLRQLENQEFKDQILSLVQVADLGVEDIQLKKELLSDEVVNSMSLPPEVLRHIKETPGQLTKINLNIAHKKYNGDNKSVGNVLFELNKQESIGTRKFFALSAPILDTLKHGKILLIDELDASLHPILTQHLIKLFHNKAINKNHAQLIFVTHDTTLINASLLRRDQIWFADKDKYGNTDLYSLVEYKKGVRGKDNFEKNYLLGRYGAVPYVNDLETL